MEIAKIFPEVPKGMLLCLVTFSSAIHIYCIDSIYVYEPLNRTSSRIVRVTAASWLAQEFRIVLPAKVKLRIVRARSILVYSIYAVHAVIVIVVLPLLLLGGVES